MARRNPPTSPMTLSAGTRTESSTSSPVSTPRTPILWSVRPTDTPSHVRSTMKAVTESWARLVGSEVLANTVYQSASRTPDIQHLVPSSTQPPGRSGSGTARVRIPITSLPAWGSERPKAARCSPRAMPGRYRSFCARSPAMSTGPVGRRVSRSIRAAVLEYLATSSMARVRPMIPAPDPPRSSGMHRPSRPAAPNASKRSLGYSPLRSISRARGCTFCWARRRTDCCSAAYSSDSSKSTRPDATGRVGHRCRPRARSGAGGAGSTGRDRVGPHGGQVTTASVPGSRPDAAPPGAARSGGAPTGAGSGGPPATDPGDPAVDVVDLRRRFGTFEAVKGVSFAVGPGETFGFLGPNGAGKSTTISMLCTLLRPTSGHARVAGYDVVAQRAEVRRRIGLVFQDTTLDDYLTAEENMRFHAELYGVPRAQAAARMADLLEMVGLWDRRKALVQTFSGG